MKRLLQLRIVLYTRQPFVALGFAAALKGSARLQLLGCCSSLADTAARLRVDGPDILLVHLGSGPSLPDLAQLHRLRPECPMVLWGGDPGGDFVFQAMQLGVRAFLPGDTPVDALLRSLGSVAEGVLCFEKAFVERVLVQPRVPLTKREGQLVWLVAQGFKNKAIGAALGITEGTVKVYIYKLFKKLGVNDRLQMALYALQNLGGTARERCQVTDALYCPPSLPAHGGAEAPPHRVN